jgi:TolA-binding protein
MKRFLCGIFLILLFFCRQQSLWANDNFEMAKKAYADGFYDICAKELETALNAVSGNFEIEARLYLGKAYYYLKEYHKAFAQLNLVLEKNPAEQFTAEALYYLGEIFSQNKEYEQANRSYEKIEEKYPASEMAPYAYFSLARNLFAEAKYAQSLEIYELLRKRFPQAVFQEELVYRIGLCHYKVADYGLAKEKFLEFLQQPKRNQYYLEAMFYLAESLYQLSDYENAGSYYQKVIAENSNQRLSLQSQYGWGWCQLNLGQSKEAEEAFAKIQLNSDDPLYSPACFAYALAKEKLNKWDEAAQIYQGMLAKEIKPADRVQAYIGIGKAMIKLSRFAESATAYESALKMLLADKQVETSGKVLEDIYFDLGWVYTNLKRDEEAISAFMQVYKNGTNVLLQSCSLCRVADIYFEEGNFAKAIRSYDAVLKEFAEPFYQEYAQYRLGLCLVKEKRIKNALIVFQSFLSNFPKSQYAANVCFQTAAINFQLGNFVLAKEYFQKIVSHYPESEFSQRALYHLGNCLYNLREYAQAIKVYDEVAKRYEQSDLAFRAEYEKGWCFYQEGELKKALNCFKEFVRRYPKLYISANVLFWLGEHYFSRQDYPEARRYFSQLLKGFPDSELAAQAALQCALTYVREKRYSEALEALADIIQRYPKYEQACRALYETGMLQLEMQKNQAAADTFEKMAQGFPESFYTKIAFKEQGDSFNKNAEYPKAIAAYRRAISVNENFNAQVQFLIAGCYENLDQFDQAISEYMKAFYLYPNGAPWSLKAQLRCAQIFEMNNKWSQAKRLYEKLAKLDGKESQVAQERLKLLQDKNNP